MQGVTYSADNWHRFFKSRFLGCVDHRLPDGKIITEPNSTAALDVAEFNEYMEKVEAFAAARDVYLDELPE